MSKYKNADELQKKLRATGIEIDEFIDQNEEDIIVDYYNGQKAGLMIASQIADELPSTEIIHCEECKHYECRCCRIFDGLTMPAPDDFCSYAERKEPKE